MNKVILRTLWISLLLLTRVAITQGENNFTGKVVYHDKWKMSGVIAHLLNSNGNVIDSAVTNNGGIYHFTNVASGDYTITFTTDQPAGGVTLEDPYLVELYLLDLYQFNSIQELASDVDGDGTITWNDYDLILTGYLNEGKPFPVGPWVFETLSVTIPTAAREGFTSRGGSSGDVNGSLVPDPKNSSIFLTNPAISLSANSSDPIEFILSSAGNHYIAGMHLVLKIPEGLSVLSVESPISAANISILNDEVRVTWIDKARQALEIADGMPLLVISTKKTGISRDGTCYSIKLSNESHFINADGQLIWGMNLVLPTINVGPKKELAVAAYPNPFRESTNLNYLIPEDGNVMISIYDQAGRQVKKIIDDSAIAGNNHVKIDGADLMPGIYHYCISYTWRDHNHNIITGTIIKSK